MRFSFAFSFFFFLFLLHIYNRFYYRIGKLNRPKYLIKYRLVYLFPPTPSTPSLYTLYALLTHSSHRNRHRHMMHSSICIPTLSKLNLNHNPFLGDCLSSRPSLPLTLRRRASLSTRALLSPTKHAVLKDFQERRALKVILTHFPFLLSLFSVFFWLFFYVLFFFFFAFFSWELYNSFFFVQSNRGINPTLDFALLFILVLIFPLNFFSLTWGIEGAKITMLFLEIMFFLQIRVFFFLWIFFI